MPDTKFLDSEQQYESLVSLFEPFLEMPLNSLPKPLHTWVSKAYHDMPGYWDKHSKEQRKRQIDEYDCQHNPARKVERAAGWLIDTMDASAWWLAESISPLNAAMLLSHRNPNSETVEDAETSSSDEMGPQDFRRLRNIFDGASKGVARTLKDWTEYARQRGLKIHSWIGEWEAWVSEVDALQAGPLVKAPAQAATPEPLKTAQTGALEPASDGPAKRRTWRDVAWPYMADVFNSGRYATAKEFYQALEKKAGGDSPFDLGIGVNRGSLFVREVSETVALKTVQNAWSEIKASREKA